MTAKEALFAEMGWAEDAKDLPGQMMFPGFGEPQKAGQNPNAGITSWQQKSPSVKLGKGGGIGGGSPAGTPQGELEAHDKKNHPDGYKGGRCKLRGKLAAQGFDVRGYDAKVHNFTAPEGYDYNNAPKGDEKDEEGDENGVGQGAEAQPATSEKSQIEKVDVGGIEVTAKDPEAKIAAEALAQLTQDPAKAIAENPALADVNPEEVKEKLPVALETLKKAEEGKSAAEKEKQTQSLIVQKEEAIEAGKKLTEEVTSEAGQLNTLVDEYNKKAAEADQLIKAHPEQESDIKANLSAEYKKFEKAFQKIDPVAQNEDGTPESPDDHAKHCKANPKSNCPFLKEAMTPEQLQQLDAQSVQEEETPETKAESVEFEYLQGPITDEQYEEYKKSEYVQDFKQKCEEYLAQGGEFDLTDQEQFPKGGLNERVISEVLEERKAAGQKVQEIDDLDFEDDGEAESAETEEKGEQEEPAEIQPIDGTPSPGKEGEQPSQQPPVDNGRRPGLMHKRDWTPQQREALQELARRIGVAAEGFRQDVSDEKFNELLNDISHFANVRNTWASTPNVSGERGAVHETLSGLMDGQIDNSYNDQTIEDIDKLLSVPREQMDPAIKESLTSFKDTLLETKKALNTTSAPLMREKIQARRQRALDQYLRLKAKYGLDNILKNGEKSEDIVKGYREDGDVNHRKGLPTVSDEADKNYKVDISGIPDVETHNGSLTNGDAIAQKMAQDIKEQARISVDPSDIKVTPLMAMTEFTFEVPEGTTLSKSQGEKIIETIKARFPLKEIQKGNERAPQKAAYTFDPNTQTFKVSVENETKGAFSQKKLLESKEFKDAVAKGGAPVILGVDAQQRPIIRDLTEIVHALMVGASGAGKSVMINDIITSLLSQSPYNIRLGLVDLAGVELPKYDGSKQMVMPTATTAEAADKLFNWYSNEMDARRELFQKAKVKDLAQYNRLGQEGKLPADLPKHLPYLPLIVDEFSDLMDSDLKSSIVEKLNKMSREARKFGVHMFFATQKGTTDFVPSSVSSQATTRIGLAQTDSVNAKKFGTPEAANIPTRSGGFQMKIGNALVNGTSGILPDEGYDEIANRFSAASTSSSQFAAPAGETAAPTQSPDNIIDGLAKTPKGKAGLKTIADRLTQGNMNPISVGEKVADMTKKLLEGMGYGYTEMKGADGKVTITPKPKEQTSEAQTQEQPSETVEGTQAATTAQSPEGTTSTEGTKEATAPETGAAESGQASGEEGFLDESELQSIGSDLGKKEVQSAARDFQSAYTNYLNALESGKNKDAAKAAYEMAFENYNQARESNGLEPVERGTGKPKPKETTPNAEETSEQEGDSVSSAGETTENVGEASSEEAKSESTQPEDKWSSYESQYEQTREGQMKRLNEERNAARKQLANELIKKGVDPKLIRNDKRWKAQEKDFANEETRINEQYPETAAEEPQEVDETQEEEVVEKKTIEASSKYDTSHLSDEDKFKFETVQSHHENARQGIKDNFSAGKIDLDEYEKQIDEEDKKFEKLKKRFGIKDTSEGEAKAETPDREETVKGETVTPEAQGENVEQTAEPETVNKKEPAAAPQEKKNPENPDGTEPPADDNPPDSGDDDSPDDGGGDDGGDDGGSGSGGAGVSTGGTTKEPAPAAEPEKPVAKVEPSAEEPKAPTDEEVAKQVAENPQIKTLEKQLAEAKTARERKSIRGKLNKIKSDLEGAIRNSATKESGTTDVRTKKNSRTEEAGKPLSEMTEEDIQSAIDNLDKDGKMEPSDFKRALKPLKDELKKRQAGAIHESKIANRENIDSTQVTDTDRQSFIDSAKSNGTWKNIQKELADILDNDVQANALRDKEAEAWLKGSKEKTKVTQEKNAYYQRKLNELIDKKIKANLSSGQNIPDKQSTRKGKNSEGEIQKNSKDSSNSIPRHEEDELRRYFMEEARENGSIEKLRDEFADYCDRNEEYKKIQDEIKTEAQKKDVDYSILNPLQEKASQIREKLQKEYLDKKIKDAGFTGPSFSEEEMTIAKQFKQDGHPLPAKKIKEFAQDIKNKDPDALARRLHTGNRTSRKVFEAITGIKLPTTTKGTYEAIDKYCGISPEERVKIDSERDKQHQKAELERKQKEEDSALEEYEKSGPRFPMDEEGKTKSLKQLLDDGWRFKQTSQGKASIWTLQSPNGDRFWKITGKTRQAFGDDVNNIIAGGVRYGENLDSEKEKAKRQEGSSPKQETIQKEAKPAAPTTATTTTGKEPPKTSTQQKAEVKAPAKSRADNIKTAAEIYARNMNLPNAAQHPMNVNMANELVTAIEKKDPKVLLSKLGQGNEMSREAFEKITGTKLPYSPKELKKVIENYCGSEIGSEKPAHKPQTQGAKPAEAPKKETPAQTPAAKKTEEGEKKSDNNGMTPEYADYLKRKEEREKAEAEKQAKIKAEREARLRQAQMGHRDNSRGLNNQSQQFEVEAMKKTDPTKSENFKAISELKPPEKIDNESANALNEQFDKVSAEIAKLEGELKRNEEEGTLKPSEIQERVGMIGHLRQGLSDVFNKRKLGQGNFTFAKKVDSSGNINGLRISSYKGTDGKMNAVKPIEKKAETTAATSQKAASQKQRTDTEKEEKSTSAKAAPKATQQEISFGDEGDERSKEQQSLRDRVKALRNKINKKGATAKDEAIAEDGGIWIPVLDEEPDGTSAWTDIFDAALYSMGGLGDDN